MNPHEEFLQLCAVSTSGELTGEERRKLDEHLLGCASCRKALHEFRQTVTSAVPAIAAQLPPDASELDRSWSLDAAESALFDRLSKEDNQVKLREATKDPMQGSDQARHAAYFPSQFRWGQMWMSYAAAVFLFAALAISAYRVGIHRGVEVATNLPIAPGTGSKLSYEEQISDLGHERETLRAQLASREAAIADLKEKVSRLKATDSARVTNSANTPNEAGKVTSGESVLAMARIADLEKELDAEKRARSEDSSRAATLEAKLGQLSEQLRERDETVASQMRRLDGRDGSFEQQQAKIAEQQELLEHDRDIRELMGARDLYIAEVYDVAKNGATQKSYGRIFFTKGKSLIFYAYDLDRQPELKNASTFQAWGQRGTDRTQALNLGIFFEDNVSKKRWVLKFDDPNKLEQIDAVFVTVEPNGGSHKPSGKPFLFAYLKINANHP
jgi:predicted  nucleic acid-binding Zn-ribbon protein